MTFYIPIESDYSQLYSHNQNFALHTRIFILRPKKQTEVRKKRAAAKKTSFIKNIKDLINVSHCHCVCTISLYSIRSEKNYSVTKKKFLFCEHLPPTEDAERSPMCVHQLVRDYLYGDLWFLV